MTTTAPNPEPLHGTEPLHNTEPLHSAEPLRGTEPLHGTELRQGMEPRQGIQHLHGRPGWDCQTCGNPWPCANAKNNLNVEFARFPSVLAIYMTAQMHDAATDLTSHGELRPPDLYERFLSWMPR